MVEGLSEEVESVHKVLLRRNRVVPSPPRRWFLLGCGPVHSVVVGVVEWVHVRRLVEEFGRPPFPPTSFGKDSGVRWTGMEVLKGFFLRKETPRV